MEDHSMKKRERMIQAEQEQSEGFSEDKINRLKNRLDALKFEENMNYTMDKLPESVEELCNIASMFNKFGSYHAAANICMGPNDGIVTVEGKAAANSEYMGSPFTMKPYVGVYYGETKVILKDKIVSVEGFSELNNSYSPYSYDIKSSLKARLKRYLLDPRARTE
jgi:hypothetical protein